MYHLPTLHDLLAFEAAARHMSFLKASEELHVTQSAVSHRIKSLEDFLGVALFIRINRRGREVEDRLNDLAVFPAWLDVQQVVERADEPGGGGEEDHGVRELDDDQAVLQAMLGAVAGVAAGAALK